MEKKYFTKLLPVDDETATKLELFLCGGEIESGDRVFDITTQMFIDLSDSDYDEINEEGWENYIKVVGRVVSDDLTFAEEGRDLNEDEVKGIAIM